MNGKQTCFIRTLNGEWLQLTNCSINFEVRRRVTRTVTRGGEGDDLVDEGSESATYTICGKVELDTYKEILKIFRSGQPYFHDPFEERELKVVFSALRFDGNTGEYTLELLEDVR
jgi:hypothetical protein